MFYNRYKAICIHTVKIQNQMTTLESEKTMD